MHGGVPRRRDPRPTAATRCCSDELGETDCAHGYIDAMMRFADRPGNRVPRLGVGCDPPGGWGCAGGPSLVSSLDGTPTAYGAA